MTRAARLKVWILQPDGLASLLLGRGLCSRKLFAATLASVLLLAIPLLVLAIRVAVSHLGNGTSRENQLLMDLGMFGTMAGLTLMLWILLGQTLRRIRSSGQLWIFFLFAAVSIFPQLMIAIVITLVVWPERGRAEKSPDHPKLDRLALGLSAILFCLSLFGISILGSLAASL